MIKIVKVVALKPVGEHLLWVNVIAQDGPMVEPLRDSLFFAKAFISFGVRAGPTVSMLMRSIFIWKWKRPAL